ncbi:MAG: hypothetical protein HKM05_10315 [Spirochaetales bacterium]|nr:hypothetical protein [Spirochaetales bacterium]
MLGDLKVYDVVEKIWRFLPRCVEEAVEHQKLDRLTLFGVDRTAILRGHSYISVIVDWLASRQPTSPSARAQVS